MPVGIKTPQNQVKLTNVSYVRIKKGKKRYEIACYKNKVLEWRNKIETDPDNVLQIPHVFINVGKGEYASKADLAKSFGKDPETGKDKTEKQIIEEILRDGELQVGEKERQAQIDRIHNEVINIVASKLVDPKTKRVYTTTMIEKALDQLSTQSSQQQQTKGEGAGADNGEEKEKEKPLPKWRGVTAKKEAKEQALFAVKALVAHQPIPVATARMRLRITCPTSILKQAVKSAPKGQSSEAGADGEAKSAGNVKDTILKMVENVETQDVTGDEWELVGSAEPGALKILTDFIGGQTKGRGRIEVLDMAIIHEDD